MLRMIFFYVKEGLSPYGFPKGLGAARRRKSLPRNHLTLLMQGPFISRALGEHPGVFDFTGTPWIFQHFELFSQTWPDIIRVPDTLCRNRQIGRFVEIMRMHMYPASVWFIRNRTVNSSMAALMWSSVALYEWLCVIQNKYPSFSGFGRERKGVYKNLLHKIKITHFYVEKSSVRRACIPIHAWYESETGSVQRKIG